MVYNKPDTPWFEIEGLRGDDWIPLYQAAHKEEAKAYLRWVLEQTDPIHDRYEDFRIAHPTAVDRRSRPHRENTRATRRSA